MAIYHFAVKILSRARGDRVVAAAAAQAAVALRDGYYGMLHNHSRRPGVEFTEILAPQSAPSWVFDREQLWNRVEAAERRWDAQLARAVEISLPVELEPAQRIELLRNFIRSEFVAQGMIADAGIRRTQLDNPNAHVLLTLRGVTAEGFGPKARQWNGRSQLKSWRAAWATCANRHLARAGHALRIDHRTLDEQQIELTPARRTGVGRPLRGFETLPEHLQVRFAELRGIAEANGAAIIEDPAIAVRALAQQRRSFTEAQLAQFLRSRTSGDAQHQAALSAVMACPELLPLKPNPGGYPEYTSRDLLEAEKSLKRRALTLAARPAGTHRRSDLRAAEVPSPSAPSTPAPSTAAEWPTGLRDAFSYVVGAGDFKVVAISRADRAELEPAARAYWHAQARRVLQGVSTADSAMLEQHDVLLVEGAEMIDLKSLERILAAAERARAKLVLLADADQLRAMGAMSPLHDLLGVGRHSDA